MATTSTPPAGDNIAASAIFKKFLASAENYIKQPTRLKKLLFDAFTKAREKKEIGTLAHEAWETLQTMFRLIKASVSGEYTGVPNTTVLAAVAVLVYFLSPIDLIPDFIPVLGLLDDVALVAWFSTTLKGEMDKFHEWELTRPALAMTSEANEPSSASKPASTSHDSAAAAPAASKPQPATESAKNAGTTDLPSSNTDSGLGSPESSTARPVHEAGPDATPTAGSTTHADAPANTTDSSHAGNSGAADTGGNVR